VGLHRNVSNSRFTLFEAAPSKIIWMKTNNYERNASKLSLLKVYRVTKLFSELVVWIGTRALILAKS
jgi:hypothetical protein